MKFLVDAQLPRRLCVWLADAGHDALHTLDMPQRNRTTDEEIVAIAARDGRIVITKDDDFVESFLVRDKPDRLLLVTTGNIANSELEALMRSNLDTIVRAFESARFVELGRTELLVHE